MKTLAGHLLYLDASAVVKLVLPEAETEALLASLPAWPHRLSSEVAVVEVLRAARRASADQEVWRRANQVLSGLHLIKISPAILEHASQVEPATLRALDALHLASALSLGEDLGAMAVYDATLAAAAGECGVRVLAPR